MEIPNPQIATAAKARRKPKLKAKPSKSKKKARGFRSIGIGHNGGPPLLPEALGPLLDDQILTIMQWAGLNAFSLRTAKNILRSGSGPVVTQLSERRAGIRVIDNRRWQESRARAR